MSATVERTAVAIVGGGLSGLAAAYRLARRDPEHRFVVVERSGRLGGRVASERRDGFLLEAGPDSLITHKPAGIELCRELGLEEELVAPARSEINTQVLYRGRLRALPAGLQLVAPTQAWPLLRSSLFSWRGKIALLGERFKRAADRGPDELLASFISSRFGQEAYERVVEPILGGLFVADADRLSLALVAPRLAELEQRCGSVTRATLAGLRRSRQRRQQPPQLALLSGMERLVERLQRQLDPHTLWTGNAVAGLSRVPGGGFRLELSDGRRLHAEAVLLACPGPAAAALLATVDRTAARRAARLDHASCATVHLAYAKDAMRRPPRGFGFFVCRGEGLPLIACSFPSEKFPQRAPAETLLCRAFLGGALQPQRLAAEDQELIDVTHATLVRLYGITAAPLLGEVRRHQQAMPQFTVAYAEAMRDLHSRIGELPGVELASSTVGAYGLPDCIVSGYQAADRVSDWLDLRGECRSVAGQSRGERQAPAPPDAI